MLIGCSSIFTTCKVIIWVSSTSLCFWSDCTLHDFSLHLKKGRIQLFHHHHLYTATDVLDHLTTISPVLGKVASVLFLAPFPASLVSLSPLSFNESFRLFHNGFNRLTFRFPFLSVAAKSV